MADPRGEATCQKPKHVLSQNAFLNGHTDTDVASFPSYYQKKYCERRSGHVLLVLSSAAGVPPIMAPKSGSELTPDARKQTFAERLLWDRIRTSPRVKPSVSVDASHRMRPGRSRCETCKQLHVRLTGEAPPPQRTQVRRRNSRMNERNLPLKVHRKTNPSVDSPPL